MKQGDLVVRKSYGGDVLFRVERSNQQISHFEGHGLSIACGCSDS